MPRNEQHVSDTAEKPDINASLTTHNEVEAQNINDRVEYSTVNWKTPPKKHMPEIHSKEKRLEGDKRSMVSLENSYGALDLVEAYRPQHVLMDMELKVEKMGRAVRKKGGTHKFSPSDK